MALRTWSWQHLGAFVVNVGDCTNTFLDRFAAVGGRWVVVVLYNDDVVAAENHRKLPDFIIRCSDRGIRVGCWLNGFGDPPAELAAAAKSLCNEFGPAMAPVVFDLELQYKSENAPLLPATLHEARKLLPTRPIGISSFGFADRQMIWNGRTLSPPASLYDLKVRWLPQWYYNYDGKYAADWCMADLKAYGSSDGNIADASAPGGRGIPLGYAHGTLEVTGQEGHSLKTGLEQLVRAKAAGFTFGFSIYVLERTPDEDFVWLEEVRGMLYKG